MKKLLFLLSIIPTICFSQGWNGIGASYKWYDDHKGSTVYYIESPEELYGLSHIVNGTFGRSIDNFSGKTIKLKKDIDLNNKKWSPIGGTLANYIYYFYGNFDGDNHTISGLNLNSRSDNTVGLFGDNHGTISNLTIEGTTNNLDLCLSMYMGYLFVGSVAAENSGTIYNCKVIHSIKTVNTYTDKSLHVYIGGICGWNYGEIIGCSYLGSMNYNMECGLIGGIAGSNSANAKIMECKSVSNTSIESKALNNMVGGICGSSFGSVKDCFFCGSIDIKATWGNSLGGICGEVPNGDGINNCISIGSISAPYGHTNRVAPITGFKSAVSNSFYVSSLTNVSGAGEDISFSELISPSTFPTFSPDIWNLRAGEIPSPNSANSKQVINIKSGLQGEFIIESQSNADTPITISSINGWMIYSIMVDGVISIIEEEAGYIMSVPANKSVTNIEVVYCSKETGVPYTNKEKYKIYSSDNSIIIENIQLGESVSVYTSSGICLFNQKSETDKYSIEVPCNDIYIVKIGDFTGKIAL